MLRTPRSLKVQAIVEPTGDEIRFSGDGNPRICSTVKDRDAVCWATSRRPNANVSSDFMATPLQASGTIDDLTPEGALLNGRKGGPQRGTKDTKMQKCRGFSVLCTLCASLWPV